MATSCLSLVVHHAISIKDIKLHIGRMNPYVTIGVVGHKFRPKPQKTNPHIHGHTDPVWESHMVVELPQDAFTDGLYNLVAEIKHHSRLPRDRLIGKVTIPLRDVLVNRERVGYLVMTSGVAHGKLVLSHSLVAAAAGDDDDDDVAVVGTPAPIPFSPVPTPVPPAPTTNPLVAMGLGAGATTIVDNMLNMAINLDDFFTN